MQSKLQIVLQIILKTSLNNASRLSAIHAVQKHGYNLTIKKKKTTKSMIFAQSVKMMINIAKLKLPKMIVKFS